MRIGLIRAAAAAVCAITIAIVGAIEMRHLEKYGHWLTYGWDVDLLSDRVDLRMPGVEHVQYARITNLSIMPEVIEECLAPGDGRAPQIPTVPERIQIMNPATGQWVTVRPDLPLGCPGAQVLHKRIWPLASFYTAPAFVAHFGRKGDSVRLVAFSSFGARPGDRRFVSPPFILTEESEPYGQHSIAIRSISFCEPAGAGGLAHSSQERCNKLERWEEGAGGRHPEIVDVLCEVEDTSGEGVFGGDSFLALTTMDELVGPASQYEFANLDTIQSTASWGRDMTMDDVKMASIHWLAPGQRQVVRIAGFDLRPLIRQQEDGLWHWQVRVNLRVESRSGDKLATRSATLSLIPSPKRLARNVGGPPEIEGEPVRIIRIAPKPRGLW